MLSAILLGHSELTPIPSLLNTPSSRYTNNSYSKLFPTCRLFRHNVKSSYVYLLSFVKLLEQRFKGANKDGNIGVGGVAQVLCAVFQ